MSLTLSKHAKIVCVGKNYADHAAEMNTAVPSEPLLFLKPATAMTTLAGDITIPTDKGSVHHELEIAFVIGDKLTNATEEAVRKSISGIGLALDLTLRDVQGELRAKGFPWDKSKGFDNSCPIECLELPAAITSADDFNNIDLKLIKNGNTQQQGNSAEMVFKTLPLIAYMSNWFTLNEGDIILTGTPAGVSALNSGDELTMELNFQGDSLLKIDSMVN